jgi:hypothetical protein
LKTGFLDISIIALIAAVATLSCVDCVTSRCEQGLLRAWTYAACGLGSAVVWLGSDCAAQTCEAGPSETCALLEIGDTLVPIDHEGRLTGPGDEVAGSMFPLLAGLGPESCRPGGRISSPEVVLGISIVRALDSAGIGRLLKEINTGDLESPRALLVPGIVVELGVGSYGAKARRLARVLAEINRDGRMPARIDLRFGSQVVVDFGRSQPSSSGGI